MIKEILSLEILFVDAFSEILSRTVICLAYWYYDYKEKHKASGLRDPLDPNQAISILFFSLSPKI